MKLKISLVFLTFFCLIGTAKAQVVEQMIAHFNGLKNVSYQSTSITKDFFSDKLYFDTAQSVIIKQGDQLTFRLKGKQQEDIYNGSNMFKLEYATHTYRIANKIDQTVLYGESLPYVIQSVSGQLKKGIKAVQLKDSVVNGKSYFHVKLKGLDSMRNNKRVYSQTTLLIDKKTKLLYYYRNNSQGFIDGTNTHLTIFSEFRFTAYQLNVKQPVDLTKLVLPANFTLEKPKVPIPFLAKGTDAPEIPLVDLKGKETQLSAHKGKVLLINFTLNGCPHCVEAIETLNQLQEKYKPGEFAIITINLFDDSTTILKYNKSFDIKYPTYTSEKAAIEKYRVQGYPLFYVVDKNGKITTAYEGFSLALGKQMVQELEQLIQ